VSYKFQEALIFVHPILGGLGLKKKEKKKGREKVIDNNIIRKEERK